MLALAAVRTARAAGADAPATFVGEKACAPCHQAETQKWRGSHHALAMQPPAPNTVRGPFTGTTFTKDGVTSTFLRRDGRYLVRTDGPDGKVHEYPVAWTFGVDPLQQYLVRLPGGRGRLQALSIAWDTRPAAAGGQRWFHLYPNERIDHRDVLHWAGPAQNWNHMCAECHSTNVEKGYRPVEDRFDTTFTDVDVSCEACHGPGSRHVRWAEATGRGEAADDPLRGFTFPLRDTSGGRWELGPGQTIARRTKPPSTRAEIETCAFCHSRRARMWDEHRPGEPLAQTHRAALLDPDLYHADGQIQDEVYEYGSFLQSRMYTAGVTCSDCHDPHSARLRASGNAVCAQCHAPATYDSPGHHHHTAGTAAAACVSCHMIERRYMVIDGRRDHSFRVPRPDLSERLGTPNACNDCHTEKTPAWAGEAVAKWYGETRRREWHWGEALHAGRSYRADAETQLVRAAGDASVPAIARASAVSLLPPYLGPRSRPAVKAALADTDPLVRRAGAEAVEALDPPERVALAAPLLRDPVRTVRLEALASLLDVPRDAFTAEQTADLQGVTAEYRRAQAANADRADAHVNLGILEMRLGNRAAARAAYETAIRRQPSYIPAYVNLADLERGEGREAAADAALRRALAVAPDTADLQAALALSLVRQRRYDEALVALGKATALEPNVPRHAYVYAVALHDTGDPKRALEVLERAHERMPGARDILVALVQYEAAADNRAAAERWARKLAETGDEGARRLLEQRGSGR